MIDLICRKALLKQIPRWLNADNTVTRDNLEAMINTQQPVDAVPVIHGHWEWGKSYTLSDKTKNRVPCSNCHVSQIEQLGMKYCTNCGALMDEVSK